MSQTICFIGATGGVANACLTLALKSGNFNVIALARNPQKLRTQLISQQGLDEATIDKSLSTVQGNGLKVADVKRTLLARISSGNDRTLPSMIVTALGGAPVLTFNMWQPWYFVTNDQPDVCGDAAGILVSALQEIYTEQPSLATIKPALTFVSTTGISRGVEDVPYWYRFLYHQLLHQAHVDKRNMENAFRDQMVKSDSVFASVTGIRPTILGGTGVLKEAKGQQSIRAGTEKEPALGYFIQRADVGTWMFENVVGSEDSRWRGEMVSLTT